jgi:putative DNA primase/helicase
LLCQEEGLKLPERYQETTNECRKENDPVLEWMEDCCVLGPEYECSSQDLNRAFREWADDRNEQGLSVKSLGAALSEKGYQRKHTMKSWKWLGIGLLTEEDQSERQDGDFRR